MTDTITRHIDIAAPVAQVWTTLTDHREFGAWFGVVMDGPFVPGQITEGKMQLKSCYGLRLATDIVAMEAPHRFAYRWPAYVSDENRYRPDLPWTHVEFRLEPQGAGTRVTVTETGFAALGLELAARCLAGNTGGWEFQLPRLASHALAHAA